MYKKIAEQVAKYFGHSNSNIRIKNFIKVDLLKET